MNGNIVFYVLMSCLNFILPILLVGYIQYVICHRRPQYGLIIPGGAVVYLIVRIIILLNTQLQGDYKIIGIFSILSPIIILITVCIQYYKYVYKKS